MPISVDALVNGQHAVSARASVENAQSNVSDWYSAGTIDKVVQAGIDQGLEQPYDSEGYQCTPSVTPTKGATVAHFTCKLRGADVPTAIDLRFTADYNPPTGR